MQIVKPRPVQAASIPGMLGMFQNVWLILYKALKYISLFLVFDNVTEKLFVAECS